MKSINQEPSEAVAFNPWGREPAPARSETVVFDELGFAIRLESLTQNVVAQCDSLGESSAIISNHIGDPDDEDADPPVPYMAAGRPVKLNAVLVRDICTLRFMQAEKLPSKDRKCFYTLENGAVKIVPEGTEGAKSVPVMARQPFNWWLGLALKCGEEYAECSGAAQKLNSRRKQGNSRSPESTTGQSSGPASD